MKHRATREHGDKGREMMALQMGHKRKRMHGLGGYTSYRNGREPMQFKRVITPDGRTICRFLPKQYPIRKRPQKMVLEQMSLSDALQELNAV